MRFLLLLWLAIYCVLPATADQAWPTPKLPEGVSAYAVGEQLLVNGIPMRLTGFVSQHKPTALAVAFRRSLGEPVVETTNNGKQVLGRAEGGFYITIQIDAADLETTQGSRGTIVVTDMNAVSRNHEKQLRDRMRFLDQFPAGSSVVSDMASEENGKSARHSVIVNQHNEQRNRDAVIAMLGKDGYVLEREVRADATTARKLPNAMTTAVTLYFSSAGKEAMAVITRTGERTAIVLNTAMSLQAIN